MVKTDEYDPKHGLHHLFSVDVRFFWTSNWFRVFIRHFPLLFEGVCPFLTDMFRCATSFTGAVLLFSHVSNQSSVLYVYLCIILLPIHENPPVSLSALHSSKVCTKSSRTYQYCFLLYSLLFEITFSFHFYPSQILTTPPFSLIPTCSVCVDPFPPFFCQMDGLILSNKNYSNGML